MNNENINIPKQNISYSQIIQTISQQLKQRKKSIFKKVALTSTPLTVSVIALIYGNRIKEDFQLSDTFFFAYLIVFSLLAVLSFIWASIMGRIFSLERTIWIDSFFDRFVLTDKESWQLAKKLFWPSVLIGLLVFLRYYLILILIEVSLFILYGFFISQKVVTFDVLLFIFSLIAVPFSFVIYSFFVKIRLRYLNFVFLDSYLTPDFSYNLLFKKTALINKATKGDAFKKTIITMLGTELAENLVSATAGLLINSATSQLGSTGQAAGAIIGMTASETAAIYRSYAQEITFYIYYKAGRLLLYNTPQSINQNLYSLLKR